MNSALSKLRELPLNEIDEVINEPSIQGSIEELKSAKPGTAHSKANIDEQVKEEEEG